MSTKRRGSNGLDWNKTVKLIESKKDRNRRNRDYIEQVKTKAHEWNVYCKTTVGFVAIYEEKIHYSGNNQSMVNFLNDERVLTILKEYCTFTATKKERKTKRKTGINHHSTEITKKRKEEKKAEENSFHTKTNCCKDFCLKPVKPIYSQTFTCDKCLKTFHSKCVELGTSQPRSCGCHLITPLIVEHKRLSWLEDLAEFKKRYLRTHLESIKHIILQRNDGYHESLSLSILPLFKPYIIDYVEGSLKEVLPDADAKLLKDFFLPELMVRTISKECNCPVLAIRRLLLEKNSET
ncbi:uncharacterized protein [Clytia hemisphaerica]|uniref:uncharacterized protein isoform X2 n=1 Tax=Clytia hemisphaerica TaxID=252671 RepID=UPI0034D4B28C